MLVFLCATGKTKLLKNWPSLPTIIGGITLAGLIIFYVAAMNYTTMANGVMLLYLAPIAAAIGAHFLYHENLSKITLALIFVAFLGIMMMLEFKIGIGHDKNRAMGLGLALLSMLCYTCFMLANRRVKENVVSATFYQLVIGAITITPFFLLTVPEISVKDSILLLAVGFFPGFLAIFLAITAINRLQAATFGTLAYVEPVSVVLYGWIIFNESLSTMQLCGCLLVIASGMIKSAITK